MTQLTRWLDHSLCSLMQDLESQPCAAGKKIDYIPHTGIAVFGKEYFFGGGPQVGIPGQSVPVPVTQVLELGETQKTCEELEAYIRNVLSLEHNEQNYDLLRHNCNHYADDVAKFLLDGTGLPASIVNVAEEALSTPQGQALKVMIENMERSMRSGGNSSSLNPFSNVGASPAVVAEAGDDTDLKAALVDLAKNEQEVRRTALQMLLKMTENVEKSPSEQKFRRIKMSNPARG
ncbi:Desumoylating isopeptidase 1 [Symbiodinium microadriaticum]|uniref:Desumoylating isopeptidase 1 n=1 Tax=Symbiodinium microadriaticum TaxID=2951 RepID=A0A1Q9D2A0_SYMMI|nr:Desumoylating isopeptidase 1 [Symbiodinium microadriaticum]